MSVLERAIAAMSPRWAVQRAKSRFVLNRFEGASKTKRTSGWKTSGTSINADTRFALPLLRSRTRDLGQNNAYAASAHREIPTNVVGEGIIPTFQGVAEEEAKRWFDTTECDAEGHHNFYGLQKLVARTVVEAGECLVWRRIRPELRVPLQLQVIEPDHLDHLKDGLLLNSGGKIIQGVEFDRLNRRVAYWVYPQHPGELTLNFNIQSERVPAEQMLHIFRTDRPGQVRGVPWGAPVVMRIRDFDSYADAQLIKQRTAASFAGFITENDMTLGAEKLDYPETIEPGTLEILAGGREITFSNPPRVDGYAEFASVSLHEVAIGYGVPYSVLTGDLRQTNFSSGRMGDRAFNRSIREWQRDVLIYPFCVPVGKWFLEALSVAGILRGTSTQTWTAPRRELTDPAREIPAIRDEVRSGLKTWAQAVREMGHDPEDFVSESHFWNEVMDRHGLVFDSDPRKVSAAGLTQARTGDMELPPTAFDDNGDTNE